MATPMKLSAADRTRPTLWDGLVVALVLISAVALLLGFRPVKADRLTATIVLDGVTLGSYDLSQGGHRLVPVDAPWPLEVELEEQRVRISHSDCGSQDCVRTGWIDLAGEQIICLPNKLIISLTGTQSTDFDAVSG